MTTSKLLIAALTLTLSLSACAEQKPPTDKAAQQPNVLVILVDDAGYQDFGFQGSEEFKTPRIDSIAKAGVSYTDAYVSTPFCSPSRAGLLTGRYTQRFGYEFNLTHQPPAGVDGNYMGLAVEEKTIADLMKARGYATVAVGKWHVGELPQFHPNKRGFDHFYGFLGGGSTYHPDNPKRQIRMERDGEPVKPQSYLTDDFAREAASYIEQLKDQPFFMYLAFNAVHTPMDVLEKDMQRFAHIQDFQRQRLAAMTWSLDRAVGTVLDSLKEQGIADDTLVIFTNDNGGDRVGLWADNTPLRGVKGTLLEGGVRVPFAMRWPGVIEAGSQSSQTVSLLDILPSALSAAGAEVPANIDGISLFNDTKKPRPLFWRYDNMAAVRDGDWKLLRFPDRPAQLYNLAKDIGEANDLAAAEPDKVLELMQVLHAWEGQMIHARWNTGTFWSQEDVRRYDDEHVHQANQKARKQLREDYY
ncbi:sulfatase-like hydrolase/transferase [Porticoccus sp. GXU_MW_L64]